MTELERKIDGAVESVLALDGSKNVEFIYLYGSVALKKSHPGSDIDLCVCFKGGDEEAFDFVMRCLSAVNSDSFDIKLFRQLPLYIKIEVFKGRLLYSKDIRRVYDIAYNTIRDYDNFIHRFNDYIGKEAIH